MRPTRFIPCLLIALACAATSLPGQAAMVTTAQMQVDHLTLDLSGIAGQRDWIREQLIAGGVAPDDAAARVAAMTDAQVARIYRRIDQHPAGASSALFWVLVLLLVSELAGWTDIIPAIRPLD